MNKTDNKKILEEFLKVMNEERHYLSTMSKEKPKEQHHICFVNENYMMDFAELNDRYIKPCARELNDGIKAKKIKCYKLPPLQGHTSITLEMNSLSIRLTTEESLINGNIYRFDIAYS